MKKHIAVLLLLLSLVVGCRNAKLGEEVELTISAAASLKEAMEEITELYEEDNKNVKLQFNFGGSGNLQQQISQGAPVDLFFSAAEDKFEILQKEGIINETDSVNLLKNELVLIVPKNAKTLTSFDQVKTDAITKLAIGTPETVPAGMYAKQSLEKLEIWDDVKEKLIFTKDVRQVLSYVETANVEAGIVYKTDALISGKVDIVSVADEKTHTPIVYPLGIIEQSENYEEAQKFYKFLQTTEALKVFERYGFSTK